MMRHVNWPCVAHQLFCQAPVMSSWPRADWHHVQLSDTHDKSRPADHREMLDYLTEMLRWFSCRFLVHRGFHHAPNESVSVRTRPVSRFVPDRALSVVHWSILQAAWRPMPSGLQLYVRNQANLIRHPYQANRAIRLLAH